LLHVSDGGCVIGLEGTDGFECLGQDSNNAICAAEEDVIGASCNAGDVGLLEGISMDGRRENGLRRLLEYAPHQQASPRRRQRIEMLSTASIRNIGCSRKAGIQLLKPC